ncbi:hypothetical protein [Trichocoleus sp. Lan]
MACQYIQQLQQQIEAWQAMRSKLGGNERSLTIALRARRRGTID